MAAIRIIQGIKAALDALKPLRLEELHAPPGVAQKIREVFGEDLTPFQVVDRIVADVRQRGDAALRDWTLKLDGVPLERFEVDPRDVTEAYRRVSSELVKALQTAAIRIEWFHRKQLPHSWIDRFNDSMLGQIVTPLKRVGVYSPGGRAAYPSTVLMEVIPAKVARVEEIIVASPVGKDGKVAPSVIVAADIVKATRVFKLGGAQAIAALAYGTETVPKVDKILGPGNIFVTLAKRLVYGTVAIDQLAGPTETLLIADDNADPELVAADLLAQAEHDTDASPILVTTSHSLAQDVERHLERQLSTLERKEIAAEALERNGVIVIVQSLAEAAELANHYAPEHLCVMVKDPWSLLPSLRNAGGIFLGQQAPEAMGDYTAGPSHVMPTMGTARFSSPLNVWDFVKITSLFAIGQIDLEEMGPPAAEIARAEGFTAHARAIEMRLRRMDRD